jgi:hypothetical protein
VERNLVEACQFPLPSVKRRPKRPQSEIAEMIVASLLAAHERQCYDCDDGVNENAKGKVYDISRLRADATIRNPRPLEPSLRRKSLTTSRLRNSGANLSLTGTEAIKQCKTFL